MKWTLVVMKDRASDSYSTPQGYRAKGEAIRAFHDAINNPESGAMYKHPEDYDLYFLGYYDDNKAAFEEAAAPLEQLAIGKNAKLQ